MGTGIIITMGGVAVSSMVMEKLLNACGKSNEAQLCSVAGFSFLGVTTIGIVIKLIQSCKHLL